VPGCNHCRVSAIVEGSPDLYRIARQFWIIDRGGKKDITEPIPPLIVANLHPFGPTLFYWDLYIAVPLQFISLCPLVIIFQNFL